MKFPKPRRTHAAMGICVVASATLVIVGPGSTAAIAGRMIGSAAIMNNSIRGIDVRDGSLTAKDFSGSVRGQRGPAGPRGETGLRGPVGPAPDKAEIKTWGIHHAFDSGTVNRFSKDSSVTVPAGTQVEVLKVDVEGNMASCGRASLEVSIQGAGYTLASGAWQQGASTWSPVFLIGGGAVTSAPTPLRFVVVCGTGSPSTAVPALDATVTLAFTERDTAATSTFD